jgi:hypothetical protein
MAAAGGRPQAGLEVVEEVLTAGWLLLSVAAFARVASGCSSGFAFTAAALTLIALDERARPARVGVVSGWSTWSRSRRASRCWRSARCLARNCRSEAQPDHADQLHGAALLIDHIHKEAGAGEGHGVGVRGAG